MLFVFFPVLISSVLFFYLFIPAGQPKDQPSGPQGVPSGKKIVEVENTKGTVGQKKGHYKQRFKVARQSNFYETLLKGGYDVSLITQLVTLARDLYDLAKLDAGTLIEMSKYEDNHQVFQIEIKLSSLKRLRFLKTNLGEWGAQIIEKEVTSEKRVLSGEILTTLWDSAQSAGVDFAVILKLADIFAWQIDFERQVRPKDSWRVVIEERKIEGIFYEWGDIYLAEYQQKKTTHKAIRFTREGKKASYYDLEGHSLQGVFLKSPLKYRRISSKFQRKRYHPILKRSRPHLGVDYAAPKGTPVRSVGSGTIEYVGRGKQSGKTVKIRHNSVYKTAYKHLSRYAKGVRRRAKVEQGQVIGYVGSTGLATGPHLHFEFYERGAFVDPLGVQFPREESLKGKELQRFQVEASESLKLIGIQPTEDVAVGVLPTTAVER